MYSLYALGSNGFDYTDGPRLLGCYQELAEAKSKAEEYWEVGESGLHIEARQMPTIWRCPYGEWETD